MAQVFLRVNGPKVVIMRVLGAINGQKAWEKGALGGVTGKTRLLVLQCYRASVSTTIFNMARTQLVSPGSDPLRLDSLVTIISRPRR